MNNIIDYYFCKVYKALMSLGLTVFKRTVDELECISLKPDATCQDLCNKAGKELVLTFAGRPILPNDEPLADLGIGSECVINVDPNMCWIVVMHEDNFKESFQFPINATPKEFRPIVKKMLKKYPGERIHLMTANSILNKMIEDTDWRDNDLKIDGVVGGVWCGGVGGGGGGGGVVVWYVWVGVVV